MNNNETMWSTEITHEGMTLRDYFAAKAMGNPENIDPVYYEQFARKCYLLADAMLKA